MKDKIEIHWWDTAAGGASCHRNISGLSADESYLGDIQFIRGSWYSRLKGELELTGPHKNMQVAMRFVEEAVGGEQIQP